MNREYNIFALRWLYDELHFEIENLLKELTKRKSEKLFRFHIFLFSLRELVGKITKNLIENFNFEENSIKEITTNIAHRLKKIKKHIPELKKRQLLLSKLHRYISKEILRERELNLIQDISDEVISSEVNIDKYKEAYLFYRAHESFLIAGRPHKFNFYIENSLCDWEKCQKWKTIWTRKFSDKIREILRDLKLDKKKTKLAFCLKTMGPVGLVLLLADIVSETEMDASIIMKRWENTKNRIIGYKPNKRDNYIMVYDLNFTSSSILELKKTLEKNNCNLRAALVLWDYETKAKEDLKSLGIDLYTIFSISDIEKSTILDREKIKDNLEDLYSLAPLFYDDVILSENIKEVEDVDKYDKCGECHKPLEVRFIRSLKGNSIMKVRYCIKCISVYAGPNDILQIKKISELEIV